MTVKDALIKELNAESNTTRAMLMCVPTAQFGWQPHPKSMTVRSLATHIAELPTWIGMTLHTDELDFQANPYQPVILDSNETLVQYFEKCLKEGIEELERADEAYFGRPWILREGETILEKSTKYGVLRMTFSQIIHHRAQLGVYLRLLNIPIPGSYGPSADSGF